MVSHEISVNFFIVISEVANSTRLRLIQFYSAHCLQELQCIVPRELPALPARLSYELWECTTKFWRQKW